ncbi:guanylate kinase [Raineyella sp. LH-20]|uniref:guanylate kinase n=1 Tax=Raineyella sp. LH-20 TaxID=3081204 RepID=UPI002955B3EF|nr:guanylate kinase [Raineyella sp. LH-20]WOP18011.1 guanylate kinase [Raineyella sp. LH-20]
MTVGPGRVVVLSGPTAVGKGTVMARFRELHPEAYVSISATTRPARPGERDGVHYWFVSDAEFDELIASGGLLEWAEVHGAARYGTPRRPVDEAVADGRTVILEIDLQGARQVKENCPDACFVFLAPPSAEELVRRLQGRGTETAEEQARRLETAATEMAARDEFDVVLVNEDVERTVAELVELCGL